MDEINQNHGIHLETTVADDAAPLCPACLEPCDPLNNYCPNCGSNEAVNPLASYMPFESIRFETGVIGKMWQKTWAPETDGIDRAINIVLLIIFYPFMLLIGLPVMIYQKIKSSKEPSEKVSAE